MSHGCWTVGWCDKTRGGKTGRAARAGPQPAPKNAGRVPFSDPPTHLSPPRITRGPCGLTTGRGGQPAYVKTDVCCACAALLVPFFFPPNSFTHIQFETLKNTNSKHLQPQSCRRASLPPRTPLFVFAVLHRPASRCHSSSTNTTVSAILYHQSLPFFLHEHHCFRRPPPPVAAILPPRTTPSVFVVLHRQHQSATVALHHCQFSSSSIANTNLRLSPSTTVFLQVLSLPP